MMIKTVVLYLKILSINWKIGKYAAKKVEYKKDPVSSARAQKIFACNSILVRLKIVRVRYQYEMQQVWGLVPAKADIHKEKSGKPDIEEV